MDQRIFLAMIGVGVSPSRSSTDARFTGAPTWKYAEP